MAYWTDLPCVLEASCNVSESSTHTRYRHGNRRSKELVAMDTGKDLSFCWCSFESLACFEVTRAPSVIYEALGIQ
ncbi:hypothetical protein CEXT_593251 [Caerostris extrusa]|uniref:Uncharacterized protein n=1 Tax=Caerostris extrusa TaxID=172846 RepID=A0AAV4SXH2_CAEEX|nr:hypothetical protein CEXT_593251 [Caerostris extrusa]